MMLGLGPAELMLLLLLSSGGNMPDAVSMFPARDYFKMRGIETTQAKLTELAGQDPSTPKAQIMQLQALRLLADEPKIDPAFLKVVRDVATGIRAKDKQGFSQKYAQRVMAAAGAKIETPKVKAKAAEGLEWFPADATMTGVIDFRLARVPGGRPAPSELAMWTFLPEKMKQQILKNVFEVLERTGNIEVYRGAVAVAQGVKGLQDSRIYTRFSGKFNQEWVVDSLHALTPLKFEAAKGPGGEDHHVAQLEETAMALIDGAELLVGVQNRLVRQRVEGVPKEERLARKLIAEMLQVKAGKKDSALKGKHVKDLLAKVPQNAMGLFVMKMPSEAKALFGLTDGKLAAPESVVFFMTPAFKAIDIQLEAMMQNEDDARTTVKGVFQFREMGIQALKNVEGIGPPGFSSRPFIQLLESLQVEAKSSSVHLRLLFPEEVLRGMVDMMIRSFPGQELEQPGEAPAPEKEGASRRTAPRPAA